MNQWNFSSISVFETTLRLHYNKHSWSQWMTFFKDSENSNKVIFLNNRIIELKLIWHWLKDVVRKRNKWIAKERIKQRQQPIIADEYDDLTSLVRGSRRSLLLARPTVCGRYIETCPMEAKSHFSHVTCALENAGHFPRKMTYLIIFLSPYNLFSWCNIYYCALR